MERLPFDASVSAKSRELLLALIDTDLEVNTLCIAACYAAKVLEIVKTAKAPIEMDGVLRQRIADPILALQRVTHEFSQVLEAAHKRDTGKLGGLRVEIPLT